MKQVFRPPGKIRKSENRAPQNTFSRISRNREGEPIIKQLIIQNIVESLSLGLLVIETDGAIFLTNGRAAEILGYPRDFLEGKGWAEVFFEANPFLDFNADFNQTIVDVIYRKEVRLQRRVWYRPPSGERRYLCVTASFLHEGPSFAGIVVLIDDQTELFLLHQRETRSLKEQHRLQQERSASLNQLAMAVAHQVRNPVVAIGGFASRLKRNYPPSSEAEHYLQHIMDGAARLERMVRAVTEYTSLTRTELAMGKSAEVLNKARSELDSAASEAGRKLEWNQAGISEQIESDPKLLQIALVEIGRNALDFAKWDTVRIFVSLTENEAGWMLSVRDDGPGISGQVRPFVFDPFFSTKAVGVGMGLTKVKRVAIEHGGDATVGESDSCGTEIRLRLPRSSKTPQPPAAKTG